MITEKTKKAIEELDRLIKDPATKETVGSYDSDICRKLSTGQAALAKGETAKVLESFKALAKDIHCLLSQEDNMALMEQSRLVAKLCKRDTYGLPRDRIVPQKATEFLQQTQVKITYQDKSILFAHRTYLDEEFWSARWDLRDEKARLWARITFDPDGVRVEDTLDPSGKSYSGGWRYGSKEGGEKQQRVGHANGAATFIRKKLTALGVLWMRHPADTEVSVLAIIDVLYDIADQDGGDVTVRSAAIALLEKFCYRTEEE